MQNLLKRKKKMKKMKNYFLLVILLKNSGYSNHLSANLEAFTSLDQSVSIQVKWVMQQFKNHMVNALLRKIMWNGLY